MSLKGTNDREFSTLTGAVPEGFDLQLKALEHLLEAGVKFHPAVMLSFSDPRDYKKLKLRLHEIHGSLPENIEEEYVVLYPPAIDRLRKAGIKPRTAHEPMKPYNSKHYP